MASEKKASLPFPTPADQDGPTDSTITSPSIGRATAPPKSPSARNAPPRHPGLPNLGALNGLMADPEVTEIMVNDLRNIMVEKDGKMQFSGFTFTRPDDLGELVEALLAGTGKTLTRDQPYVDLNLSDGSRVNIVGPPVSPFGPCITIRKFPARRLSMEDLVHLAMLDKRMAHFLHACVVGRMNLLISGGTDSGKTTLLNALAGYIPKSERVITIEDTPELALAHPNSVKLITQLKTAKSEGVSSRELVANALRMRPDRIVVGECRKGEAFDMLQAMNTGHAGSMSTIHANSPRDALSRLETLCMMAGSELPLIAIRKQINSAVDVIVQLKRFRNGKRRVTAITEITGIEGETITLQDIYLYATDSANSQNSDAGAFRGTGFVPTFLDRLRDQGIELPQGFFA